MNAAAEAVRVDVWLVSLTTSGEELAALAGVLDADELARAERFRSRDLYHRFVADHARRRQILAGYLNVCPADVTYHIAPNGRPQVAGGGVLFSASRSDAVALLAVVDAKPSVLLGVDVESRRAVGNVMSLATTTCTPAEREALALTPDAADLFLRLWTRKEAAAKAVGLGLSLDLRELDVLHDEIAVPMPGSPTLQLRDLDTSGWNCIAALASNRRIEIAWRSLEELSKYAM